MKIYTIITEGVLDGKKYQFQQEVEPEEISSKWAEAKEEADLVKSDWDLMQIKLVVEDVESELVSNDPELWSSYVIDSEELLTYQS